ncbi:MAG: hypothetical protein N3A61_02750, partial [Ignavibacteria bacterium]|nr:hypothetical protein [Ignavibacteria bacterium]
MTNRKRNTFRLTLIFVVTLILFLVICRFIPFPLRISTQGEIFPKAKWLLIRGNNGQIISCLIDYELGRVSEYEITQFERGEFISVNFNNHLRDKKELEKDDTVVVVRSSNILDRIIQAQGELEVAIANLNSQQSSEKEPLIREAENRLKYTQEKIKEQQILYDRAKQLYEKGFSSKEEFELQKLNLDLLKIEDEIYSAQIENLKTGAKPEIIK